MKNTVENPDRSVNENVRVIPGPGDAKDHIPGTD